jgi:hypothetical protein
MDSGGHRIGKMSMARSQEVVSVSFQLSVKNHGAHFENAFGLKWGVSLSRME